MRKFLATIAMCIILIGTLAPVTFSLTEKSEINENLLSLKNISVQVQEVFAAIPPGGCVLPQVANAAGTDCVTPPPPEDNNVGSTVADFDCGNFDFACKLTNFTVDLITFVPNFIAVLVGALSDVFLKISISPETYGTVTGSGIESGIRDAWKIVRDFSNIGFIFALFVAAFMLILDKTSVGGTQFEPKKVVVRVIIMALLVNFSMLFCRLTIQTADIFSNLLYSKIGSYDYSETKNDTAATVGNLFNETLKIKSVSLPLISLSDPQSLFTEAKITPQDSGRNASYLVIGFAIFFVLLLLIWTFATMMFIFLGRILGLWLGIILSPLAFVSFAIPFLEKNEFIGFDSWLKNFFQLAFMTPVYLFFMYITISILNIEGIGDGVMGGDIADTSPWLVLVLKQVVTTMIPLLLGCFLLLQGKKIATKMSGQIGEMVGGMSGAVTGLAMGAATGGTALLARQTAGRVGTNIANSDTLNNLKTKGYGIGTAATFAGMGASKLGATSFDVRGIKGFDKATEKVTGEKVNMGIDKFGGIRKGGFDAEGGARDLARGARNWVEDKKTQFAEAKAASMVPSKGSSAERDKREKEDKLARAKAAAEREKTKVEMEAENQNVVKVLAQLNIDKAGMTSRNPELEKDLKDRTALKTTKETLETKEKDLKEKIETLEVKEKDTTITTTERIELAAARADAATNKTELSKTKDDIKKIDNKEDVKAFDKIDKQAKTLDKALAKEPNLAKRENMTIREVKQQSANAKIVAEGSLEKVLMDEAKEKYTKEKESFDTLDKDMKKLESAIRKMNKDNDKNPETYSAEEIDDAKKQLITTREKREEQYKKQKKAKDDHKAAEDAYKDAYGDDVKNLESASKDAEDEYKKDPNIKKRLKDSRDIVDQAQMELNDTVNDISNKVYDNQKKLLDVLENSAAKSAPQIGQINENLEVFANAQNGWKGVVNKITQTGARTINDATKSVNAGLIDTANMGILGRGNNRSSDAVRKIIKK